MNIGVLYIISHAPLASSWVLSTESINRSDAFSSAENGGKLVINFWHNLSKWGDHHVHCSVWIDNLNHCTSCFPSTSTKWACRHGAWEDWQHYRNTVLCQRAVICVINTWVLTAFVMSCICDRSSARWWWRLHKQAQTNKYHPSHTHIYLLCKDFISPTHQQEVSSVNVFVVPRWLGNSSLNKTNHCLCTMLIKTIVLSVTDGTSHQTTFAYFQKAIIIQPITHDWWL